MEIDAPFDAEAASKKWSGLTSKLKVVSDRLFYEMLADILKIQLGHKWQQDTAVLQEQESDFTHNLYYQDQTEADQPENIPPSETIHVHSELGGLVEDFQIRQELLPGNLRHKLLWKSSPTVSLLAGGQVLNPGIFLPVRLKLRPRSLVAARLWAAHEHTLRSYPDIRSLPKDEYPMELEKVRES